MGGLEMLKIVAEGGALVLLAAVLFGVFYLALRLGPSAIAAVNGVTAELARLGALVNANTAAVNEARARSSEAAADMSELRGAALATGQHPAIPHLSQPPPDSSRKR